MLLAPIDSTVYVCYNVVMTKQVSVDDQLKEMVAQFTDDYIDEWAAKGNDIDGLHDISDKFVQDLKAQLLATIISELKPKVVVKELGNELITEGYNQALKDIKDVLTNLLGKAK